MHTTRHNGQGLCGRHDPVSGILHTCNHACVDGRRAVPQIRVHDQPYRKPNHLLRYEQAV